MIEIRPDIKQIKAYHVPDATGLIKLDAMENPYQWPEDMMQGWQQTLRQIEINRYPDPQGQMVIEQLRKHMPIPESAQVILGNGSDELIQIMMLALSGENKVVLSPAPSFVMYEMIALFTGMQFVSTPLNPDFSLDMTTFKQHIDHYQPALVFLAYPNNPTGNLFKQQDIIDIVECSPGLVVVDEAYAPFTNATLINQVMSYQNLVVMRTLSKMGLAGLRLGYLVGANQWLEHFDKVRLPYNINILTQITVRFALQHIATLNQQTQQISQDREVLFSALNALEGIRPYPSEANFILFKTPENQATALFEALKQAGILIKNLSPAGGALTDCLRVTVGQPQENQAFIQALTAILKG